jgi:hypothetical protein
MRPWAGVGRWQAGRAAFMIFLTIFHLPNFEMQNGNLTSVQNSPNFA